MDKNLSAGLSLLLLSLLACEPVIAIGWRELFIVFILVAFIFGPPIYRFIRKLENFIKRNEQKEK